MEGLWEVMKMNVSAMYKEQSRHLLPAIVHDGEHAYVLLNPRHMQTKTMRDISKSLSKAISEWDKIGPADSYV